MTKGKQPYKKKPTKRKSRRKPQNNSLKIHNLIKKKLRLASLSNPHKQEALNKAKVDVATHECALCECYMYSGVSNEKFKELKLKHPKKKFKREKPQADHINSVVEVGVGFVDWNTYIERLFCDTDGYQILCDECHKEKSIKENKER